VNVDPATILEEHHEVYDENDEPIADLVNLPYEDIDGNDVNIYDSGKNKIERRVQFFSSTAPPGGPLFQLQDATTMFDRFHYGDRTGNVSISVYPQAFMMQFGHVQANTVLPESHRAAQGINSELLSGTRQGPRYSGNSGEQSDNDGDDDDDDYQPSDEPSDDDRLLGGEELDTQEVDDLLHRHSVEPLKGVFFQGYNELQHRIARRSGEAETMHGTVTAALAGQYAQQTERRKADEMSTYVEREMPFDRMKRKLTSNDADLRPPTDLRLENYWTINFSGIAQEKRTGRSDEILEVLYLISMTFLQGCVREDHHPTSGHMG
jgi:hypothetical protein